jgi:hypothetical protein
LPAMVLSSAEPGPDPRVDIKHIVKGYNNDKIPR